MPAKKTKAVEPRTIDIIRRCSALDRRKMTIPEWDNLDLYFGKITVADWDTVEARNPETNMDRNILLIITKAKLEDGSPAFSMADRHQIRAEADLTVLQSVINFMYASAYNSLEEAEEAVKTDPFSD